MDMKSDSGEGSERGELVRNFHLLEEYINNHQKDGGRNMDIKGHSGEVLDGNDEHVTGN